MASYRSPRWRADAWAVTTPDTEGAGLTSAYQGMYWGRPSSVKVRCKRSQWDSTGKILHNISAKTITDSVILHSAVNKPSPAVQSMFLQLVRCNQKKVPQKPPSVIWEPPSEIGQTASTPLFQRNLISVKKYLGIMRWDIIQMNQANCQLPPQSANYSITQCNYPTYLWKQIKVKQLFKSVVIIHQQHSPPFFLHEPLRMLPQI